MTYPNDIRQENTFGIRYEGLRIIPSRAAMRELYKCGKALVDVVEILEFGQDAPRKRKHGTIERWLGKKNKVYNAVIVRDYNERLKEECWVLIHFGKFSK